MSEVVCAFWDTADANTNVLNAVHRSFYRPNRILNGRSPSKTSRTGGVDPTSPCYSRCARYGGSQEYLRLRSNGGYCRRTLDILLAWLYVPLCLNKLALPAIPSVLVHHLQILPSTERDWLH